MPEYYNLYSPAIDFLFHCLGYQAPPEIYEGIWLLFSGVDGEKSSIVLNFLLKNFPASVRSPLQSRITYHPWVCLYERSVT